MTHTQLPSSPSSLTQVPLGSVQSVEWLYVAHGNNDEALKVVLVGGLRGLQSLPPSPQSHQLSYMTLRKSAHLSARSLVFFS